MIVKVSWLPSFQLELDATDFQHLVQCAATFACSSGRALQASTHCLSAVCSPPVPAHHVNSVHTQAVKSTETTQSAAPQQRSYSTALPSKLLRTAPPERSRADCVAAASALQKPPGESMF